MGNEHLFNDKELIVNFHFIIPFNLEGKTMKSFRLKVEEPGLPIQEQINKLVNKYLSSTTYLGTIIPVKYQLWLRRNDNDDVLLAVKDKNNKASSFLDYNIKPNDHLCLIPVMKEIVDINENVLQGSDYRLWWEWKELDAYCARRKADRSDSTTPISYRIRRKNAKKIPVEYEIWYRVKSIIGVEGDPQPRKPIFGDLHKMNITLPDDYPWAKGNPVFTFLTKVWHPNIRYSGSDKGLVFLNWKNWKELKSGTLTSLKDLVLLMERYLKYDLYHAESTDSNYVDSDVAQWVHEEGEPNGWIRFGQDDHDKPKHEERPIEKEKPKLIQTKKKKLMI